VNRSFSQFLGARDLKFGRTRSYRIDRVDGAEVVLLEFHVGVGERILSASVVCTKEGFEKIELKDGNGEKFDIDLREIKNDSDIDTKEIKEANFREL
jgi:hypothetical protein